MQETAGEGLLLYESQITDAEQKQAVLELIINTCLRLNCVSEDNYDTLVSNIYSYCSKIIKKSEQCKIVLYCCYLYTNPLVPLPYIGEPSTNTRAAEEVRQAGQHRNK